MIASNMKFRVRYLFALPIILNFCLILLHLDFIYIRSVNENISLNTRFTSCLKHKSLFNKTRSSHTLMDFEYGTSKDYLIKADKEKVILLYNIQRHVFKFNKQGTVETEMCQYDNCRIIEDKTKILKADAVIFNVGSRNERMGSDPPVQSELRNPNQIWIFTSLDPPVDYLNRDYEALSWQNTMNWSSLYRLDSDIPRPFGSLRTHPSPPNIDYESVYNNKTKNALWIVRQCQSASLRRQYVNEMMKHGFDVDILGICGVDGEPVSEEMLEEILPSYKFYLGFEASLCSDFITRRFFGYYNYNLIIVARGGENYRQLLPTETYINTADFDNIPTLVEYLKTLGNDKESYIKLLRKKNQYYSIMYEPENNMCELCKRLNNISQYAKSYGSIADFLNREQCQRPVDL